MIITKIIIERRISKKPMQVFTFARNCILAVNTVYTQYAGGC